MTHHHSSAVEWTGHTVVDNDGDKIGSVEEVYLDTETDEPEWLAVKTGLFGTKVSFVPIAQASETGDDIRVPYSKDQVKGAPKADTDQELSQEEEAALYSHYGLDYSESRSGTVGRDTSGPTTDDAMTRSEEELRVGTARRERGRARLRKYVVTEEVTKTVPVQREEVRVEREPITEGNVDDAMSGPDISDEEHEVVLHEDEVVAEKRAVPKERVRLEKDTVTDEETVSEEVRKEQIETDADNARRR